MNQLPYADMLDHPRHISKKHKPLSNVQRAAQYLPYAALTGYDEVVTEEIRRTDMEKELDEYELAALDRKLQYIRNHLGEREKIGFTYFQPDRKKDGGAYISCQAVVKKVDEYEMRILLEDETVIPVQHILSIELPIEFGEESDDNPVFMNRQTMHRKPARVSRPLDLPLRSTIWPVGATARHPSFRTPPAGLTRTATLPIYG